ncbi:hypothetical protein REMIM1_PF00611 (plasmid) [Rhizobium etli bv. mimosae str. Mim1]|nr:hypothetical protein REMIM1_PF00611 [Rhizobium etli bv. mimosae str. Mim1]
MVYPHRRLATLTRVSSTMLPFPRTPKLSTSFQSQTGNPSVHTACGPGAQQPYNRRDDAIGQQIRLLLPDGLAALPAGLSL